jgi:diadenosine tetraphosphatase ApaH/serine/threonine PP2A family protein phosphatase
MSTAYMHLVYFLAVQIKKAIMEKFAVISDIHANLEALQAVIDDIDRQGDIEKIFCLGDIVGYGGSPVEVLDIIMKRCEFTVKGNHDDALFNGCERFNDSAARAIRCHLDILSAENKRKQERLDYLKNLPETMALEKFMFVHASPRNPVMEYILPNDPMFNPMKMEDIFSFVDSICFVGHTHFPGVFVEEEDDFIHYSPAEIGMEFSFDEGQKAIVNVSAAGQPRDSDPRACYAVVQDNIIQWRRVEYDIDKAISKIKEIEGLDDKNGKRLLKGR